MGDRGVIVGWSGDAVQLEADNPNIKFVAAGDGRPPLDGQHAGAGGAPDAFTAEKYMDFVYEPEIQADIAAYVNYICPVLA